MSALLGSNRWRDFLCPKTRNDKPQKSKANADKENSSPTKKRPMVNADRETAADIFKRLVANNPRFVEVKNTGQAFVIVGARPPTKG